MLETFFKPALINVDLESSDKDELFEEMVELFARGGCELDRAEALDALIAREEKMTTGIVPSVAIPHASCPSVKNGSCFCSEATEQPCTLRSCSSWL